MPTTTSTTRNLLSIAAVLAHLLLSGCASTIPAAPKEERAASDPWEPMNRRISAFNDNVDRFTLKPIAKAYETVSPSFVRRGINNFYNNLRGPLHIVSNVLQGKLQRGGSETVRLVLNSAFGIGGLVDVASLAGMETYREDFDQTFAVWGIPSGPYLVLPFMGPSTLRGLVARPFDSAADPILYIDHDETRIAVKAGDLVNTRQQLFAAEALIEDSYDRYLAIRESYLQNRKFVIYDGDPPEDDDFYDEFYDEFEDPEEE